MAEKKGVGKGKHVKTLSNVGFNYNSAKAILPAKIKPKLSDYRMWNQELERLNKEELLLCKKIKNISIKFKELQLKRIVTEANPTPSCDRRQKSLERSLKHINYLLKTRKKHNLAELYP